MKLSFRPIDLEKHSNVCVQFRLDGFVCSFGADPKAWAKPFQPDEYLDWLRKKIAGDPERAVHLWSGEGSDAEIIGQIELGTLADEPETGYVNFYYLVPAYRGSGVSKELDAYVESYFHRHGLTRLKLSVSPTNSRALRYYAKFGWKDLGPRPGHPEVHFMEKWLSAASDKIQSSMSK